MFLLGTLSQYVRRSPSLRVHVASPRGCIGAQGTIRRESGQYGYTGDKGPTMGDILKFRNARGEMVEVETVPAARLKNEPATVIDRVVSGHAVAITRHDKPRAVLVSYEDFRELAAAREAPLAALAAEFDRL